MTEVKKDKDSTINAVAEKLATEIKVEAGKAAGTGTFVFSEEAVAKALEAFNAERGDKKPELTLDTLKQAQVFESDLESAVVLAAGKVGLAAMKADKDLKEIESTFKVGSNKIEVTQFREHSVRNHAYDSNKEGSQERIPKNGHVNTRRHAVGDAALKRAQDQILELAGDFI